jgi:hypothetical protein
MRRAALRDGYTQLSAGSSDVVTNIVNQGASGNFVTASAGANARAYNSAGALLASSSSLAGPSFNLANIGTPTASYVYGGSGDLAGHILRWDGAAWSYPNAGYSSRYVATTPGDNRLVLLYATSGGGGEHRVRFSDPGLPETFTANSYVDVTPGDNEYINCACVWRDKLFVFKQTKFFVFYGTSADATGQPIFNYRTVATGVGSSTTGVLGGAVAMDDALYFVGDHGLYRTTGGPPEKVSGPVDSIFGIGSAGYFTGGVTSMAGAGPIGRFRRKVLIHHTTTNSLVYDTETNRWSFWGIPAVASFNWFPASTDALVFSTSVGVIHKMGSAFTTDNGTAIASKYRTGFLDFGAPEQEKWIRQMMLSGTGTVNVKTAVNDAVALSSATSVAMGTSPAVGTGRWSQGTRGRNISVDISASSGAWSLSHLSLDIGGIRAAGVRAA